MRLHSFDQNARVRRVVPQDDSKEAACDGHIADDAIVDAKPVDPGPWKALDANGLDAKPRRLLQADAARAGGDAQRATRWLGVCVPASLPLLRSDDLYVADRDTWRLRVDRRHGRRPLEIRSDHETAVRESRTGAKHDRIAEDLRRRRRR